MKKIVNLVRDFNRKVKFIKNIKNIKEDIAGLERFEYKGIRIITGKRKFITRYKLMTCIDELPTMVLNKMVESKFLIRVDKKICKEDIYRKTLGMYGSNVIVLNNNLFTTKRVLFHEIGHFIDNKIGMYKTGSYSFESEFSEQYEEIFNKYRAKFLANRSNYFGTKIELLAEAYSCYLLKKKRFRKSYPELCDFMTQQIIQLN